MSPERYRGGPGGGRGCEEGGRSVGPGGSAGLRIILLFKMGSAWCKQF